MIGQLLCLDKAMQTQLLAITFYGGGGGWSPPPENFEIKNLGKMETPLEEI